MKSCEHIIFVFSCIISLWRLFLNTSRLKRCNKISDRNWGPPWMINYWICCTSFCQHVTAWEVASCFWAESEKHKAFFLSSKRKTREKKKGFWFCLVPFKSTFGYCANHQRALVPLNSRRSPRYHSVGHCSSPTHFFLTSSLFYLSL